MLDKIKESIEEAGKPDIIIWGGDNHDHSITTNLTQTLTATKVVKEFIDETFPGTVVIPTFGNHDLAPMNLQDMNDISHPLMKELGDIWDSWFSPEVKMEFTKHSFYSYNIKDHPLADENLKKKLDKTRFIVWNPQA